MHTTKYVIRQYAVCIFIKFDTHVNISRLQKWPHRHTAETAVTRFAKPQQHQHTSLYFKFIALNYNQKNIIQFKFLFPRSFIRWRFRLFFPLCVCLCGAFGVLLLFTVRIAILLLGIYLFFSLSFVFFFQFCGCVSVWLPQNQCLQIKNLGSFSA